MIQPGDLVLAHSKGAFGALIRLAQWLRPSWRKWRKWNHAAIVIGITPSGMVRCVQMGRRGQIVDLPDVAPGGYTFVRSCPAIVDRIKAVDFAIRQVGIRYSYVTIATIALNLLSPKPLRIDFRRDNSALICSALVARAWEHGGWDCPTDPFQITPAELAMLTDRKR